MKKHVVHRTQVFNLQGRDLCDRNDLSLIGAGKTSPYYEFVYFFLLFLGSDSDRCSFSAREIFFHPTLVNGDSSVITVSVVLQRRRLSAVKRLSSMAIPLRDSVLVSFRFFTFTPLVLVSLSSVTERAISQ